MRDYLSERLRQGVKSVTVTADRICLQRIIGDHDVMVETLSVAKAAQMYEALWPHYAVDTHRGSLSKMRTLGAWITRKGWARTNPWNEVSPVGQRNKGKEQLTIDEARKFYSLGLQRAQSGDDGALGALMCLMMGLRASEVTSREPRDLDDNGRLLRIPYGKTKNAQRTLEVPDELRPLLAVRAARGGRLLPYTRWWLRNEVADLCAAAGVPSVSPHGLRGTYATIGIESGAAMKVVSAALGHGGTEVTERHYVAQDAASTAQSRRTMTILQGGRG
jgi:integrase